jgi:hypothetical protein
MHTGYTYTGGDGKKMAGQEAGLSVARMFAPAFPDGTLSVLRVFTRGNTAIAEMRAPGHAAGSA